MPFQELFELGVLPLDANQLLLELDRVSLVELRELLQKHLLLDQTQHKLLRLGVQLSGQLPCSQLLLNQLLPALVLTRLDYAVT